MQEITPAVRRELKARAHHLEPVVIIGNAGLTPQVTREIEAALKAHELIKVRVLGDDRQARMDLAGSVCEQTGAQSVQQIGKLLVLYRKRPPEDEKAPVRRKAVKKGPRKTKRSFQKS